MIDTSGYLPGEVCASAEALADSGLYCFVSSISVYPSFASPVNEDSLVAQLGDLPDDEVTDESYGALKALCEETVRDVLADRALIVRPGLIAGPHDPTGRFTYWPHRVARGGEVLAPAPPEKPLQAIDVRDLAEWTVLACERGIGGVYNATHSGVSWREMLATCSDVAGSDASVTWVAPEFLVAEGVGPWMELPLWLVHPDAEYADRVDVSRALAAGLTFRPLEETVRGALEHAKTTDAAGLTPEREAALLMEWHGREPASGSD